MDREKNREATHSLTPDDRGITRRRFLGVLGAALAASCKPKRQPSVQPRVQHPHVAPAVQPTRNEDIPNTFQPAPGNERETMRYNDWPQSTLNPIERAEAEGRVREFIERLNRLDSEILRQFGIRSGIGDTRHYSMNELPPDPRFNPVRDIHDTLENLSMSEQARVRAMVSSSDVLASFERVSADIFSLKDTDSFWRVLTVFAKGNCEGRAFAAVAQYERAHSIKMVMPRDDFYYSARLKDYVPTGSNIYSQDIDPRNIPGRSTLFDNAQLDSLNAHPGWAGRRRQQQFRELAGNGAIVQLAKDADFTLAEYFSLIKAIIHNRELAPANVRENDSVIAQRLVTANRDFAETSLLDHETNAVIVFHGSDHEHWGDSVTIPGNHLGRSDDSWDKIAAAAGVSRSKVHRFGANPERRGPNPLPALYRAMSHSRGKTFVAFDTHGDSDYLQVDDRTPDMKLTPADLARSLLDRVRATQDPETLGQMTLCMEACYTYDFTHNLLQEMQSQWTADAASICTFANLTLPTIIIPVQEGSYAAHNFKAFRVLLKQLVGIRRDRGIKGERILKNVQPIGYREHDFTIFTSGTGKVTEIAQRDRSDDARLA